MTAGRRSVRADADGHRIPVVSVHENDIAAGGQLLGFLGVLLALPVAAVAMVLLRYAHEQYKHSHLYVADEEEPSPIILSSHDLPDDEPDANSV